MSTPMSNEYRAYLSSVMIYSNQGPTPEPGQYTAYRIRNGPWEEVIPPVSHGAKTGRNQPCPCNSGKKYKHCCRK